jgi:hypothetical protein
MTVALSLNLILILGAAYLLALTFVIGLCMAAGASDSRLRREEREEPEGLRTAAPVL